MKYLVTGSRMQQISVEVEATSVQEAIDLADAAPQSDVEQWDSTTLWSDVEALDPYQ